MTPAQIQQVLQTAVQAPSVHNTQPWRFEVDGDVLRVYADRSRLLARQDPGGRELLVSCGGAAWHAWLAVRGLDRACRLDWLPEPADPDLLAQLTVQDPAPAPPQERGLLDAVPLRHTDRSAFAPDPVPEAVLADLRRAAEHEDAYLSVEQSADKVLALEVLVARADQLLHADPQVAAELRHWVREGDHPADGVPAGALPDHGRGRGSSLTLRDFAPLDAPVPHDLEPPAPERPVLAVLSTDGDAPLDWLRSGAALGRVLLTATAAGLSANPQTQVLEVPGLRERLVQELGLVGRPQMLLRLGYPQGPGSPAAGRRPVPDVLES